MKCKKCGAENPDGSKFCSSCGSKLENNVCPKCGTSNPDGASFCSLCGASLAKEEVFEAEPQLDSQPDESIKRCRICGYENQADEKYCKKCGSQLVDIKDGAGYQANEAQSMYKQASNEGGPGLVIGIVSIVCSTICCCFFFVGIIGGIVGIILNVTALNKNTYNKSKATAGLICSIIALVIGIIITLYIIIAINSPEFQEAYQEAYNQFMQEYQNGMYGN